MKRYVNRTSLHLGIEHRQQPPSSEQRWVAGGVQGFMHLCTLPLVRQDWTARVHQLPGGRAHHSEMCKLRGRSSGIRQDLPECTWWPRRGTFRLRPGVPCELLMFGLPSPGLTRVRVFFFVSFLQSTYRSWQQIIKLFPRHYGSS